MKNQESASHPSLRHAEGPTRFYVTQVGVFEWFNRGCRLILLGAFVFNIRSQNSENLKNQFPTVLSVDFGIRVLWSIWSKRPKLLGRFGWCEALYASANLHNRRSLDAGGLPQICQIRSHFLKFEYQLLIWSHGTNKTIIICIALHFGRVKLEFGWFLTGRPRHVLHMR